MVDGSVEKVHERVYRVGTPLSGVETEIYLLLGDQVALVDSGVAQSVPDYLEPALAALDMALSDIDFIINTHPHFDHAGGNAALKRASGVQVLLHHADELLSIGPDAFMDSRFDVSYYMRTLGREDLLAARRALLEANVAEGTLVDHWLAGGDSIDLGQGIVLQVLHTPGHTAGSLSLYWPREEMLFSGDSVQGRGSHPGLLPFYFHASEYLGSGTRLCDLPVAVLCMGHGFQTGGIYNLPVRRGPTARETLRESVRVAELIDRAVCAALDAEAPKQNLVEFARATYGLLRYDLPLILDRDLGLPLQTLATIDAHLAARCRTGAVPPSQGKGIP